jgi:GT2 family glycosyltransferase
MNPIVSIVILNWNGWHYTINCLESLYKNSYNHYYVIIVDNGSNDNSVEEIIKYCSGQSIKKRTNNPINYIFLTANDAVENNIQHHNFKQLIIIKNEINYGFSKGNNIGIVYALNVLQSEYILTLNNDTTVDKNFLTSLVSTAERECNIGACQSKILSMKDPSFIDAIGINTSVIGSYQIGYKQKDTDKYNKDLEIFGACACSALYKSDMLKHIGLFDEDFFAYYEDVDLAWRARRNQWKTLYVHNSVIYHVGSATGSNIKDFYLARNRLSYLLKNAPFYMIIIGLIRFISKLPVIIKVKYAGKRIDGDDHIISHFMIMLKKRKQQGTNKLSPESYYR